MKTVNKIFLQFSIYHDNVVCRIVFTNPVTMKTEESNLYSLSEINCIISMWKMNELMGSFAIGCKLSENVVIELM